MKKTLLTLTIFILTIFTAQAQTVSVPQLINYQGMLTDANGQPLETKEYKISVSIFMQAMGGTAIWGPQVFEKVPVIRGHFNVILGPKDAAGRNITDAFISDNAYLEISIGDGVPISPRQQIFSVPYAIQSEKSRKSEWASDGYGFAPIGSIIAWHKNMEQTPALPDGWIECNGQEIIDSDSLYNGQSAPNLNNNLNYEDRGMFLRGNTTSGVYQDDQLQDHQHEYTHAYDDTNRGTSSGHAADNKWKTYQTGNPLNCKHGPDETRPVNMSVVWIIRIK
ncbi:MAG: hypothetical protein GY749_33785 [Desulfobacteraceae bacterium]|nr:hypothetical protein [Desulfobacteraceae bacterium]